MGNESVIRLVKLNMLVIQETVFLKAIRERALRLKKFVPQNSITGRPSISSETEHFKGAY